MKVTISDILAALDREAPFDLAEDWDNVGLLVGNPDQEIRSVLIGLDATNALMDEATSLGADTVLTHHPVIFRPLPNINTASPEGKILEKALSQKISIIACHTNLDSAKEGVSDILASSLGLTELTPLLPAAGSAEPGVGTGRIGSFQQPLPITDFIAKAIDVLDLPTLQVAGPMPEFVSRVAVCGGSGSDFAPAAYAAGADIYLTGEIKHNIARWAEERDFCLIEGTHYGTEQPAVQLLATKLERLASANGWKIKIMQSRQEKHPFVCLQQDSFTKA
ncbi:MULTISPECIES: Nif3-like dinuclear metal center hexameric protein [Desulfosediminicola]|uniref:Nif3-like dinuclear metal center hexameric protein n=1 Tax=Desulfosediminicola TaxID=2886823 RepID=UPI0010ACBC75|nr:Nif3-like dinuclear metal center hexameric protein [Desulfosediminicola ganghwensis]